MKKTLKLAALALCAVLLLAACGKPDLPEGMTEEDLTARAQAVIDAVNARDYAL